MKGNRYCWSVSLLSCCATLWMACGSADNHSIDVSALAAEPAALFQTETELLSFDGALGAFGTAVALSTEFVVVGAPGDNAGVGAVYVLSRQSGQWEKFYAPDAVVAPGATAILCSG